MQQTKSKILSILLSLVMLLSLLPTTALAAGNYPDRVRVYNASGNITSLSDGQRLVTNDGSATSYTVGSAATAAVTDNAHRWDTKIEITNVTTGQEYAITKGSTAPTEGWQDGGVFTGLKKDTAYTVYTRVKATPTMAASDSVTTSVKTKKAMSLLVFNWEELGSLGS